MSNKIPNIEIAKGKSFCARGKISDCDSPHIDGIGVESLRVCFGFENLTMLRYYSLTCRGAVRVVWLEGGRWIAKGRVAVETY